MLVLFLGNIISSEGVEVDIRKTDALRNCRRPLTPIDIRSFFGQADYYKSLVEGFSSIASPLTTLTQKCKEFEWSEF